MARASLRVWPGSPHPRGATWNGLGVNFALFAENAEGVELCLFDARGRRELHRVQLPEYTDEIWHAYLPEVRPGKLYGYRVYGPYAPERGHRFNHHKLLLDPYAKALSGTVRWSDAHFGYRIGHPKADLSFDRRNDASGMPKCIVVDTAFTWGADRPPRTPWGQTVLYELHVRGYTMRHPEVPGPLRGTFAGLGSPAVIRHLRELGVTAVELLPVHAFLDDRHLVQRGLRNYWGYNTLGFFAPDPRYLRTGSLAEFRTCVHHLHDAGIEVILNVVYNHTAEGSELGPTLCFRGIDNAAYYRLAPDSPRYYLDPTGCGNALDLRHPRVLQLMMDSLRFWVEEMHVDGFRFDLATTLAREDEGFDAHCGFLDAFRQDPVLSAVKPVAEPWDVGPDGYRLGQFPPGWAEWNDRYRSAVRRFWKGEFGVVGELASRLVGSADPFDRRGRRPWSSVNFVTAHDGFTLRDLVSYDQKHNEENGEDNRDGTDENHSWNCGAEGPTHDAAIRALHLRQSRNLLATLILSQGTPMLVAGDEFGRSQRGNNNAYCHDDEISWVDWEGIDAEGRELLEFTRELVRLRLCNAAFRRERFFAGGPADRDLRWLRTDGEEMTREDWEDAGARTLAFRLSGETAVPSPPANAAPGRGLGFFVVLNAHAESVPHRLPGPGDAGERWEVLIATAGAPGEEAARLGAGQDYAAPPRSLTVFACRSGSR